MIAPNPYGRRLVLWLDTDRSSAKVDEFSSTSLRVHTALGGRNRGERLPIRDGKSVLDTVRCQHDRSLDRVVVCCHGYQDRLVRAFWGVHSDRGKAALPKWCSLDQLCATLGPKLLQQDVVVSLAACNAARDPDVPKGWGAEAYVDGGARSFAALLRDGLLPHCPEVVVLGHTQAGHTTGNPSGREFRAPAGSPGRGILPMAWGADAPESATLRRQWANRVKGAMAERWMMGEAVEWPERP